VSRKVICCGSLLLAIAKLGHTHGDTLYPKLRILLHRCV
jgi:hypothetical protein